MVTLGFIYAVICTLFIGLILSSKKIKQTTAGDWRSQLIVVKMILLWPAFAALFSLVGVLYVSLRGLELLGSRYPKF